VRITEDIKYIGVNDHRTELFESLYHIPNGVSYNSYVVLDEKIAVLDTVDAGYVEEWLYKLQGVLAEREPKYLIVQHMEPDHSAGIAAFAEKYQSAIVVASEKAFQMMKNFFGVDFADRRRIIADGDELALGKHRLRFFAAPMVHWPEVILTYDATEKVLFSADAFGKFGANDVQDNWIDEARRYYIGIVGKYGLFVQKLLTKVSELPIRVICPLHGPVLKEDIDTYITLYDTWSSYRPEEEGVLIAYASIYGNTRKAARLLERELYKRGCRVKTMDLARCDRAEAVAQAFRYSKLVLACATYNAELFPAMREYIDCLQERFYSNRTVAFIENGSWAIIAAKLMRERLEKCKNLTFAETVIRITSSVSEENQIQIEKLAQELTRREDIKQ